MPTYNLLPLMLLPWYWLIIVVLCLCHCVSFRLCLRCVLFIVLLCIVFFCIVFAFVCSCVMCFCFVCLVVSILKEEFWRDYCNSKKNLECLLILCCCLIPLLLLLYYLKYCIALFWSCLYSSQYIVSTIVILYAAIYLSLKLRRTTVLSISFWLWHVRSHPSKARRINQSHEPVWA